MMMQLRLLGSFELRRIDGARVALPGRQSMAIIACLGLAEGFSLARDRLADLIWAGRGEQADVLSSPGARAAAPRARRGRSAFGRHGRSAGEASIPNRSTSTSPASAPPPALRAAPRKRSTLYRGPLLEDFPLRPNEPLGEWFGGHRERLHDIARALMLRLLRSGEGSQALAERLIALDPLCEEGYRFLIRRFAAEGDLAGAQRRYEACANAFAAAGLQTSLEIRALMDDARAEIASASAGPFQVAHPGAATQATHWLRAALGQPNPLQRPEARFLPEIADRPSIAVLPFDDLSETERASRSLSRRLRDRGNHGGSKPHPRTLRLRAPFRLRLSGSPEGRARHRGRAWRALSRRRRGFAKRQTPFAATCA